MSWSVGIDLGGTNIAVGLVDGSLEIVDRENTKTRVPRSADSIAASMASCVRRLLERNALQVSDLDAVGLGLPGLVNEKKGILIKAANLGLDHIDFVSLLRPYFPHTRLSVSNDGDCAIRGELLAGGAAQQESILLLTLGTGVGGGFVCGRKIFRGATGLGIEPGHVAIEAEGGPLCTCGRQGCLEVYVSIRGLNRLIREGLQGGAPSSLRHSIKEDDPSHNVRIFFAHAGSGDPVALRVRDRYAGYLAAGIRTVTVLYRPHMILLGGGISHAGDLLLEPLRRILNAEKSDDCILSLPPIAVSRLGNDAGIVGAAMLHREDLACVR